MATKLLWLGMDITDVQRFLGHKNIETTRHYAETPAATLRRKFDRLTDPTVRALLSGILHIRGDEIFFRKIASLETSSHLLMHKVEMFTLLQAFIRFPAFEAFSQPACALLQSLQRGAQFLCAVRIVQHSKRFRFGDFLQKLRRDLQVVHRL
ncbi:hypothetical protein ACWGTO_33545, partial [Mesorhizobium sp. PL10]